MSCRQNNSKLLADQNIDASKLIIELKQRSDDLTLLCRGKKAEKDEIVSAKSTPGKKRIEQLRLSQLEQLAIRNLELSWNFDFLNYPGAPNPFTNGSFMTRAYSGYVSPTN